MKRIILLLIAVFIAKLASAQTIETGFRANFNNSGWQGQVWQSVADLTRQGDQIADLHNRRGFSAGIYALMPLTEIVSLESGLFYDQKGMGVRIRPFESFLSPQLKTTVQLDYLTAPLNLAIKTWGNLHLTGGASVSKLINSKLGVRGSWLGVGLGHAFPVRQAFNEWDFALQGGAVYRFDNGMHLKAEYRHGLSRLNNGLLDADVYNTGLSVGFGFKF